MKLPAFSQPSALLLSLVLTSSAVARAGAVTTDDQFAEPAVHETSPAPSIPLPLTSVSEPAREIYADRTHQPFYSLLESRYWQGLAALSILGLVVFAAWQMLLIRRLAKEMATAARFTNRSAQAAAQLAAATIQLANLERPWVVVGKKTLSGFPLDEDSVLFPVTVEIFWEVTNVGRSPAIVDDLSTAVICAPAADIAEPAYGRALAAGEILIPPGDGYAGRSRKEIARREYGDLVQQNRNLCIVFYGRIQYRDPARQTRHVTRFVHRWVFEKNEMVLDEARPAKYIEFT